MGILMGGSAVGYGSWKIGKGVGDLVASVPGYVVGGAIGAAMYAVNKMKGDGGDS